MNVVERCESDFRGQREKRENFVRVNLMCLDNFVESMRYRNLKKKMTGEATREIVEGDEIKMRTQSG